VQRYLRNYRVSPEQVRMERPVAWTVLTNFAQFHFIRVNKDAPTFSFALDDLWKRREEFWDLLALENLETGRIEELYEQWHKAGLDQRFLADLKRWRLLLVNGFALRNQTRSLDDITHASQQLLNRLQVEQARPRLFTLRGFSRRLHGKNFCGITPRIAFSGNQTQVQRRTVQAAAALRHARAGQQHPFHPRRPRTAFPRCRRDLRL
jgi:hypothetical protein